MKFLKRHWKISCLLGGQNFENQPKTGRHEHMKKEKKGSWNTGRQKENEKEEWKTTGKQE